MTTPDTPATDAKRRHASLAGLLEHDPDNPLLLADAAEAAFAAERIDAAAELIARQARLGPLAPGQAHLAGLIAMRRERWSEAAEHFAALLESGHRAPAIRFNAAYALTRAGRADEAIALLDDDTVAMLPQAAALLVTLLHAAGDLQEAAARGRALLERHPTDRALNAALSTLAIDVEDLALAARTAGAAGDHPEAIATRATLALHAEDHGQAARLFDAALERNPGLPRAWIGRGLVALAGGNPAAAAGDLDRGAEMFGDHLGSWIAAGWARLLAGDHAGARARFETALALDDRFAEAQGGLAVLDVLDGETQRARRRTDVALRLDRECLAGNLAASLLAAGEGRTEDAARIVEAALNAPLDASGDTIARALARQALR